MAGGQVYKKRKSAWAGSKSSDIRVTPVKLDLLFTPRTAHWQQAHRWSGAGPYEVCFSLYLLVVVDDVHRNPNPAYDPDRFHDFLRRMRPGSG